MSNVNQTAKPAKNIGVSPHITQAHSTYSLIVCLKVKVISTYNHIVRWQLQIYLQRINICKLTNGSICVNVK